MKSKKAKKAEGKGQMAEEQKFMQRCIELAKKGAGYVSPNPLVGCLIIKNGKVIGEGYHKKFGEAHAEVNAIRDTKRKGHSLKGSTLYVNLEPCSHYGKTPPCVNAIIENKIAKVVIGVKDPHPFVNGAGIKTLKANGIKVVTGVLEKECIELNKFFFKQVITGIPYVTLKAAQSLDGFIADKNYNSKWISSPASRKLVHQWRSEYDAVLIGRNTLEKDNPKLTVRSFKGRNPYRIVLDTNLKASLDYNLFTDKNKSKTIVVTSINASKRKIEELYKRGIGIIFCKAKKGKLNLLEGLTKISDLGINSILVEGGSEVYSDFIKYKLADELFLFTSPKKLGSGIPFIKNVKLILEKSSTEFQISGNDLLMKVKL